MVQIEDVINEMITTQILNTFIISPRFTDYKGHSVHKTLRPDLGKLIMEDQDERSEDLAPELGKLDNNKLREVVKKLVAEEVREFKETLPQSGGKPGEEHLATTTAKIGLTNASDKERQLALEDIVFTYAEGNVGEIANMTVEQFGNVIQLARDPFQFIFTNVFKKFARGAGVLALVTIIYAAVSFIVAELFKDGRPLDRRFRRTVRDEILIFTNEREQQEIRQGFRSVIVTTIAGLRGDQIGRIGQVSGNLYNPAAVPIDRIHPKRAEEPDPISYGRTSRGGRRRFGGR